MDPFKREKGWLVGKYQMGDKVERKEVYTKATACAARVVTKAKRGALESALHIAGHCSSLHPWSSAACGQRRQLPGGETNFCAGMGGGL